jgi:hypothetical protein
MRLWRSRPAPLKPMGCASAGLARERDGPALPTTTALAQSDLGRERMLDLIALRHDLAGSRLTFDRTLDRFLHRDNCNLESSCCRPHPSG